MNYLVPGTMSYRTHTVDLVMQLSEFEKKLFGAWTSRCNEAFCALTNEPLNYVLNGPETRRILRQTIAKKTTGTPFEHYGAIFPSIWVFAGPSLLVIFEKFIIFLFFDRYFRGIYLNLFNSGRRHAMEQFWLTGRTISGMTGRALTDSSVAERSFQSEVITLSALHCRHDQ